MASEFIDQVVVSGGSGVVNIPIPGTAMTNDFIIAFGSASMPGTDLTEFDAYSFGPNVWFASQSSNGVPTGPRVAFYCVRKLFAGETDLVLTPLNASLTNHVQTVLQVWRGAAQIFAGPLGEYNTGFDAEPTPIIGGNIAFSATMTVDATSITSSDIGSTGFTNSALESNVRVDVRGFTQAEGGSIYPVPTYQYSPLVDDAGLFSIGFSGAPEPATPAAWTLPALQWTAEGSVTPFVPTGGVATKRFDAGTGSEWYLVAPVVDSGDELHTKVIKPARVTGKLTNASLMIYTYDVSAGINLDDLEAGINSATGAIPLPDTTTVAQSPLMSVNCPNAALSTMRISGDDRGEAARDEVHEAVYQQAIQGVRR